MKDRLSDWLVAGKVHQVVTEHLRSGWPETFAEYREAFRRFGTRKIRLIAREFLEEPCIRNKVLYLPIPKHRRQLKVWLCHELAHVVFEWEGEPTLNYPPEWGDHEYWAWLIEQIIAHERQPCPEIWAPADRLVFKLVAR